METQTHNMYAQQIIDINGGFDSSYRKIRLPLELELHPNYDDPTPTLPEYTNWVLNQNTSNNKRRVHRLVIFLFNIIYVLTLIQASIVTFLGFISYSEIIVALINREEVGIRIPADFLNINGMFLHYLDSIPQELYILYPLLFLVFISSCYLLFPIIVYFLRESYKRRFILTKPNKQLLVLSDILLDLDEVGDLSNLDNLDDYDNSNNLSFMYVRPEGTKLVLKGVDPDWELEQIIMGFLPKTGVHQFLAVIFAFLNSVFAIIGLIFSGDFVFLTILVVSFLYLLFAGVRYLRAFLTYSIVIQMLRKNLTQQIISLSSAETKIFDDTHADLEEIDAKLDLASARQSLRYLHKLPSFPYARYFTLVAKIVSIISLISYQFGPVLIL